MTISSRMKSIRQKGEKMRNNSITRRGFLKGLSGCIALLLSTASDSLFTIRTQTAFAQSVPMERYVCTVCGYIYDPSQGDPTSAIPPGTPFDKVPDNWVCPDCGADKSAFVVYT